MLFNIFMGMSVNSLVDIVHELMQQIQQTQRPFVVFPFQACDVVMQLGEFSLESDEGRFV